MSFLAWCFVGISFIASAAGSCFVGRWAARHGYFVTMPRRRDLHCRPTPRIGGLVVIAVFTILILLFNRLEPDFFSALGFPFAISGIDIDKRLLGVLVGGVLLAFIMALDDVRGLRPGWKLLGQIAVWAVVVSAGIGITYLNNPFGGSVDLARWRSAFEVGGTIYHLVWLADLLLLVWLVGMMNAINFIDGADGLAAGLGVLGFVALGLLSLLRPDIDQPAIAFLAFCAAAALLGFLIFNFYPAKIFLGDAGAMWIGYLLAVLSVISGAKMATLFLVLALPIIDGLLVVGGRLRRHQNPLTTPDQTHIHHRFIKAGFSVPQAVIAIYTISAIYGLIALTTRGAVKWIMIAILSIATAVFLVFLSRSSQRRSRVGG